MRGRLRRSRRCGHGLSGGCRCVCGLPSWLSAAGLGSRLTYLRETDMRRCLHGLVIAVGGALIGAVPSLGSGAEESAVNPPPKPADWAALAQLPDWSGVWTPNITDQNARMKSDPIPWTPQAAAQAQKLVAAEKAGNPKGLFVNCLPE